jgi:hypothetical protein
VRELDERLGFGDLVAQHLTDSRKGKNTQLPLADLLRQSIYSRIAGYEDVLVKASGRLIKHARYYWLMLAESHLTRRLFGGMVRRIAALPVPTG